MNKDPYSFECKRCGNCCRGKGYVYVKKREIRRMATFLSKNLIDFDLDFLNTYNGRKILKSRANQDCIFLEDGLCRVHEVKPDQCRQWPFWPQLFNSAKSFYEAKSYCEGLGEFEYSDFKNSPRQPSFPV